jgi:DNA-binding XRE family transcriptional regulator
VDQSSRDSEYSPWEYLPYRININSLAQRSKKHARRQIQPASGPEKAFGDALREIRKKKSISQERLALESGLDRTYISLIERGINSPTIRAVVRIAAILQVPASRIVRRMEDLLAGSELK